MILIAIEFGETPLLMIKWLGVVAGAFAGAFTAGLVGALVVRLARPQAPMPGKARALVRLVGAAAGGLIVWLVLRDMHGPGLGAGGNGIGGRGSGNSPAEEVKKDNKKPPNEKIEPLKDADKRVVKDDDKPLHVFVLGLKDLKDRLKTETPNIENCYWIRGDPETLVRDLEGLKKEVRLRVKDTGRKVFIDETPNSPDKDNPDFSRPLERWLRDQNFYTQKP